MPSPHPADSVKSMTSSSDFDTGFCSWRGEISYNEVGTISDLEKKIAVRSETGKSAMKNVRELNKKLNNLNQYLGCETEREFPTHSKAQKENSL